MNKIIQHIILIIFIIIPSVTFSQYTINNTGGKLNNLGTIRVNSGQTKDLPDTIGGRVEFLQERAVSQQMIPNIVYNQLVIANSALKLISDERKDGDVVRPIVVRDSLIVRDSADFTNRWIGLNSEEVHAHSTVKNTARYSNSKDLVLNGTDKAQNLMGNGYFSRIRIENKYGVNVVDGGFKVGESLTLKEGELRNSSADNFVMADSSRIIRFTESSLAFEPLLDRRISVHYKGEGNITTGAEIPKGDNSLSNLYVEKSGGELSLDRNASVIDTLYVGVKVNAYEDTLTLQGSLNPIFADGNDVQIDGKFKRNTLIIGEPILLNAKSIWAKFNSEAGKGTLASIYSEVRAKKFHTLPLGEEKVERTYLLAGFDGAGNQVDGGINMDFNFAWRDVSDANIDESNGLVPEDVVWQQWLDTRWVNIIPKDKPSLNNLTGWASGYAENLFSFGYYAIGPANSGYPSFYTFRATVLLEGPYIQGTRGLMATNLWERNLIKAADLNAYPLNLDTRLNAEFLAQIPDSVVDLVVIELRKARNAEPSLVKTAYIKNDGRLVDKEGNTLTFKVSEGIDSAGGKYFVAVRHRNHNSIISELPLPIDGNTRDTTYNLSKPEMVEGGTANLRLVYANSEGEQYYALKGGFLAKDAEGLNNQLFFMSNYTRPYEHTASWKGFSKIGYFDEDYNLSGIITTKDFNVSWNNRLAQ